MKLSEAIRLGAMSTEPGFDGFMVAGGPRCALGAAADAIGIPAAVDDRGPGVPYSELRQRFPILNKSVAHPFKDDSEWQWQVCDVIWTLNDAQTWTRDQAAEWVETIERAQEPVIATEDHSALEPVVELGAQR